MDKIKITVIRRFKPEDVFGQEYKSPSGKVITECTAFKDGQEFVSENLNKPEDFCGWAWRDIYKDLSVLSFGGNFWQDWTEPGKMYTACTDGVRPVCFKLKRI